MRIEAEDQYEVHSDLRHYHNWQHVCQVIDGLCQILGDVSNISPALHLAALWHDAVYLPGAENGLNEKASALALHCYWNHYRYEEDMILQQAKSLIFTTGTKGYEAQTCINPAQLGQFVYTAVRDCATMYTTDEFLLEHKLRFFRAVNRRNVRRMRFMQEKFDRARQAKELTVIT